MSHPNPTHDRQNQYPEDDAAFRKGIKKEMGNVSKIMKRGTKKYNAKTKALRLKETHERWYEQ